MAAKKVIKEHTMKQSESGTKEPEAKTTDLRKRLKAMMQKELEQFPVTLSKLDPKERVHVICKLMPYVFPKVEAVSHKEGEIGLFNKFV